MDGKGKSWKMLSSRPGRAQSLEHIGFSSPGRTDKDMSNVETTTGSALNIGSRTNNSKQTASDGAGRLTREDDMRILVGCEYSGRVRDAFARQGHTAISCDLRDTEAPNGWHIKADLLEVIKSGAESFDMMIAHPYCTYNTLAGIRWMYHPEDTALPAEQRRRHPKYPTRMDDFMQGVAFFNALKNCDIPKVALENSKPHGLAMQHIGRYDQVVQPWHFGSPFTKGAALWLKGLPALKSSHDKSDFAPGEIVAACHHMSPGPNRERERSRTDPAIAEAMAVQWGCIA